MLDGSFSSAQFQVGANANQTITVQIGTAAPTALGAYQYNNSSSPVSGSALASGDLTINGVNVGTSVSGSADDIVVAVNGVTSQSGVTATATSSITATNAPTGKVDLQSGDLVINGVNIGAVTGSFNTATQGASIASAINAKTASTGVSATANSVNGQITLASSTGKTIAVTSANGTAGAARLENATGLEVSASSTQAAGTLTLAGTKGTGVATMAFADVTNGDTFTVGSTIFEFQTAGTTGAIVGGHVIIGDTYTNDATLNTEVLQAVNGANIGVTATSTGGTNVTLTDNFVGVETTASHTITDGGGGAVTAITNTAGTGIAENATVILNGSTYTFVKGSSSGNNISLTQTGNNAAALALAATALRPRSMGTTGEAQRSDVFGRCGRRHGDLGPPRYPGQRDGGGHGHGGWRRPDLCGDGDGC